MKQSLYIGILLFTLFSCTEEIKIPLPNNEQEIVVEGWIENDQPARVLLTRSAGYFDPIFIDSLANYIVLDAEVYVSEAGGPEEKLTLTYDENYFPPFFYASPTLRGEIGKAYDLRIEADGKTMRSTTTILDTIRPDSLWFELEVGFDSLGYLVGMVTDPDTAGNRYRFYTKRIGRDQVYEPVLGDLREDVLVNGLSFETFFYRGEAATDTDSTGEELNYFRLGDTVVLKTSQLDFDHFEFWVSIDNNSGGNPFGSPGNVRSNIENGFGIWGGYASTYDTLIAIP